MAPSAAGGLRAQDDADLDHGRFSYSGAELVAAWFQ
jgi:hypothetical protein